MIMEIHLVSFRVLSTPHGALGTSQKEKRPKQNIITFNSTRCIRNSLGLPVLSKVDKPTFNSTRCIRNWLNDNKHFNLDLAFNSTRCIRNLQFCRRGHVCVLSTPHGALGT